MAVALQNGGVGVGTPLSTQPQVANPYGQQTPNTSPAGYYLANGGNPAMVQMYMQYLQTLPNGGAGIPPDQLMAQWKQGTGGDPTSKGLTYSNGQYVDSSNNPYSNAQGQQAAVQNSNLEWNTMFNKSNVYNNGGRLNVPSAQNPTGFAQVANTTQANAPMQTQAPTPARAPTPFEQSQTGTTTPTPAPATPAPAPTQPALNTGAQYTNTPQATQANAGQGINEATGKVQQVNPYQSNQAANPYRLARPNGWNI